MVVGGVCGRCGAPGGDVHGTLQCGADAGHGTTVDTLEEAARSGFVLSVETHNRLNMKAF